LAVVAENVAWLVKQMAPPPAAAILDGGCGPGWYSHNLARHGYQVTGIDIAQPFLDYARNTAEAAGLTCTFLNCSLFELPFNQEFEIILLINSVLKQLTQPEIGTLWGHLKRALRPGGQIIAEVSLTPAHFPTMEATVQESFSLHTCSPWSDRFHAWLQRELTFPATRERVSHHLILVEGERTPQEYWSRFAFHAPESLIGLWQRQGFQVRGLFGSRLGQPYQAEDKYGFFWLIAEE
jgi:ubiquinone/menaquinone biosynthesis C-methylase UbiE